MSWLSDISDYIGLTKEGNFGGGSPSAGSTNPGSSASSSEASIWPSLIEAGTGLAGTYFTLSEDKAMNDQQIQLAKDELAAKLAAAKGGGGGGGSGNAVRLAKMGHLSQLYQNWGQLAAKAAESESQAAQATGRLGTDPIIARLGVLR